MPAGVTFKSVSTSATGNHTCGIGSNDKAYCWGYNSYGVLGDNTTTSQPTPTAVAQGATPAGVTFKSISAGVVIPALLAQTTKPIVGVITVMDN